MHNAQLDFRAREDSLNRFRETLEPIHAGDQDILHATVLEVGQHACPELRAFRIARPQAENLPRRDLRLVASQVDADDQVDHALADMAVEAGFDDDRVQIHDRIHRLPPPAAGLAKL